MREESKVRHTERCKESHGEQETREGWAMERQREKDGRDKEQRAKNREQRTNVHIVHLEREGVLFVW